MGAVLVLDPGLGHICYENTTCCCYFETVALFFNDQAKKVAMLVAALAALYIYRTYWCTVGLDRHDVCCIIICRNL